MASGEKVNENVFYVQAPGYCSGSTSCSTRNIYFCDANGTRLNGYVFYVTYMSSGVYCSYSTQFTFTYYNTSDSLISETITYNSDAVVTIDFSSLDIRDDMYFLSDQGNLVATSKMYYYPTITTYSWVEVS